MEVVPNTSWSISARKAFQYPFSRSFRILIAVENNVFVSEMSPQISRNV